MQVRYPAILAAAAVLLAPVAAAATPAELKALLDQGKADEAYRAGRRTPEQMGSPAFDFVFGIAAINAGKAAEGVLALERFVLAFPESEAARVELARGYFVLGEDGRAREEFEAARALKPAPEVARLIDEYLDAIRAREAKYQPTAMAYLMLGGGYDSNPRAGVDNPEITLPVFGTVTVTDAGLRRGDQAAEYGAGFRLTAPLAANVTGFATGSADVRRYPDEGDFDQSVYAGSLGAAARWGNWGARAAAVVAYQSLDRHPYRRLHGLALDGSWIPDERNAFTLGLQGGQHGYFGSNGVRDSDFHTVSAGWRRLFAGRWRPEVELTGTAGREKNKYDDRQDLSRDIYGARVGGSVSPWRGWTLGAGASWQRSDYREPDPTLLTTREDTYVAGEANVEWKFAPAFSVRAEVLKARNDSNLALYEYRRHAAMLRLRYETR